MSVNGVFDSRLSGINIAAAFAETPDLPTDEVRLLPLRLSFRDPSELSALIPLCRGQEPDFLPVSLGELTRLPIDIMDARVLANTRLPGSDALE